MYKAQMLGMLVRCRPAEARSIIGTALARYKNQVDAAEALGVGRRSLQRWIKSLGVTLGVSTIRRARKPKKIEQVKRPRGRPRKNTCA